MELRIANHNDYNVISMFDHHIDENELAISIELGRVLTIYDEEKEFVGWLRYNLFWDQIPFINMLYIREEYRNQRYGSKLINCFEKDMREFGYDKVMVSTQENESAKDFYTKLGYEKIGGFTLPNEECELIFYKELKRKK